MLKETFKKYWHIVFALYCPIYLSWFFMLESRPDNLGTNIHIPFDDLIPFCELFIIPYLLWFAYIAFTVVFFFFYDRGEFIKYATFLIIGMTISLTICTVFPNYQSMRPDALAEDNIFSAIVLKLYNIDDNANVLPSVHVLNSIAAHFAIAKSTFFCNKKILKAGSFVLMVLICLSTVFLKQHSVLDGLCAFVIAVILYLFIYSNISIPAMIKLTKNR